MAEPKNLAAIRKWVKEHRPDIYPHFDVYIKQDAFILLMSIGFESGRVFQHENPDLPVGDPLTYLD